MRTSFFAIAVVALVGCTDASLGEDTAYRRLVGNFDSYDACIADKALPTCYQTLTLCANGRVLIDLDNRPQDGRYEIEDNVAVAEIGGTMIEFDLATRSSAQLPGRHSWELVTPSFTGCDVE